MIVPRVSFFLRDHEGECVINLDFTGSTLFLVLLLFAAGLVCIIKGGDIFVDAATWIAEASGIPKTRTRASPAWSWQSSRPLRR